MASLQPPPPLEPDGAALFLDFDGTLVELAETPDAVAVSPGLAPLLARLQRRLGGRLAIVSGRALADLERHLPEAGLAFSGSHGLELRLAGGAAVPLSAPLGLDALRERVDAFAAPVPGLIVEDKPAGIALHYRLAPEQAGRADAFMTALAKERGLAVQRGAMVVELRPGGATKGDALKAFMSEPDYVGALPWFVGDDLTDEHGFAAARALGGAGILVGPERETAARYRLDSVGAVVDWLGTAL